MATRRGSFDRFTAIRGLVTEGNKGNFPQDAAVDLDNVEILIDGTVMRRKGLDIEPNGTRDNNVYPLDLDVRNNASVSYFLWENVGDTGLDFAVTQFGATVIIRENTVPLSGATVRATVDLDAAPFVITPGQAELFKCEYAADRNFLIIANKGANTALVNMAPDPLDIGQRTVTVVTELRPKIRVETPLAPPAKSFSFGASLSQLEEFDLRNAGWPYLTVTTTDAVGTASKKVDPVAEVNSVLSFYPSTSVLFAACRLREAVSEAAVEAFDPRKVESSNFGSGYTPRGKVIVDYHTLDVNQELLAIAFEEGGSVITAGTATRITNFRINSVAVHSGRAFFAAKRYDSQDIIMFSQLYDSNFEDKTVGERTLEICHQDADPTAEQINDLLPTDGIVIQPSNTGEIFRLVEFGRGIVVFAENGIWWLGGNDQQTGITATNFRFEKVSEDPVVGAHNVTLAGGRMFYMARAGIHLLEYDNQGALTDSNITESTIDAVYRGFNLGGLRHAQGWYDETTRRIYWTIPGAGNTAGNFQADATLILVLSLDVQGFFLYSIGSDVNGHFPRLLFPIQAEQTETDTVEEAVTTIGGAAVTTVALDNITVVAQVIVEDLPTVGFAVSRFDGTNNLIEYVRFTGDTFHDWAYIGGTLTIPAAGVDYSSFIEFAYVAPSSKDHGLQTPYIHSFFMNERPEEIDKIEIIYPL